MRAPAAKVKPRIAKTAMFPAPVGGWIKNQNLATPGATRPDGSKVNGAYVLENFFPTATGVRMRRGSELFCFVGDGSKTTTALFSYVNGNNRKLFAATEDAIYDVTNPPASALLVDELDNIFSDEMGNHLLGSEQSVRVADVDSLSGGDWSVVQTATPGGVFLRAVNGFDDPLVFDGTDWGTTPAIEADDLDPTTLSYVWVYKKRTFFIEKDSLTAWYLPVDSIGGDAVALPLGGVFSRGGSLLFGAVWSIESGNGPAEYCVFVSTEGEAAVYSGDDPSVAASWTKVGVYRIGKPLGPKAHLRAGGDLVIATDIGFVPLSQAMQRDFSALSPAAISYAIEEAWNDAVAERSISGWTCEVWPTKQMVVLALPTGSNDTPQMFVANARTGAWGLYSGWNGRCLQLFNDRLFFGSDNGQVIEAEVTGADQGRPYTAAYVPLFESFKAPASLKTSLLMRATLLAPTEIVPQMSLQADFQLRMPSAPDDAGFAGSNVWGGGVWGLSTWGATAEKRKFQRWQSVGGSGYAIATGLQLTSGAIIPPDVDIVQTEITYDQGDIVT